MRRRTIVALLAAAAAMPVPIDATQGSQDRIVVIRPVTDSGAPVPDLTEAELAVTLNGKPADVVLRRASGQTGAAGAAVTGGRLPPFATNVPQGVGGATIYVAIDGFAEPDAIKATLADLLPAVPPEVPVGVLHLTNSARNITPTIDRSMVIAAAADGSARLPSGVGIQCEAIGILENLANIVGGVGARANVVTVIALSDYLPAPGQPPTGGNGRCAVTASSVDALRRAANGSLGQIVTTSVRRTAAARARRLSAGLNAVHEALSGTPAFAATLAAAIDSAPVYYFVTVSASSATVDSDDLRVDVERDGVTVLWRDLDRAAMEGATGGTAGARSALRNVTAASDLQLVASTASGPAAGDPRRKLITVFEPANGGVTLREAALGLFDQTGRLWAQWTATAPELGSRPLLVGTLAPPGIYDVKVAAVDDRGRLGIVTERIDLTGVEPHMSDLLLGVLDQGSFTPRLRFDQEATAVAMCEMHGAAASERMAAVVAVSRETDGQVIAQGPAEILAPKQDLRVAYGTVDIGALPPGDYQITMTVTGENVEVRLRRTLRKVARAAVVDLVDRLPPRPEVKHGTQRRRH